MPVEPDVQPPVPAQVSPGPDRVYWPQLDGLRFIAFLMVYIFHGGVPPEAGVRRHHPFVLSTSSRAVTATTPSSAIPCFRTSRLTSFFPTSRRRVRSIRIGPDTTCETMLVW